MSKKYYLVTGGAGYIGSHVVQKLIDSGHVVDIIDNLSTGSMKTLDRLKQNGWDGDFLHSSIGDMQKVSLFMHGKKYDGVFHFASFISAPESCKNPLHYYENNIAQFVYFLSTVRLLGLTNFVLSSSASVYGNTSLCVESGVSAPMCPYGTTKVMMEQILRDTSIAYPDFKFVSLRYFNVAGSNIDMKIGDFRIEDKANVIPKFLTALATRNPELKIYGTDYNTQDGTCIRDYIHVDDLADAHLLAVEHADNEIYNIGNGRGYSVRHILESCLTVTGKSATILEIDRREGDPDCLIADVNKIANTLGWSAKITDLNVITRSAWEWYRKLRNLP